MKRFLSSCCPAVLVLTLALLGNASHVRANSEISLPLSSVSYDGGGTLTLSGSNSYTGSTIRNAGTLTNVTPVSIPGNAASGFATLLSSGGLTLSGFLPVSNLTATVIPALSGSVDGLNIKTNADTGVIHVKATVTLRNTTGTAFHNVTATVYLSDDNTLSGDDTTLLTLNLSDYVPEGKIGKHKTLDLPLKHRVPSLLASYLAGKYLIVVLGADDLGTVSVAPIVVGPITLP